MSKEPSAVELILENCESIVFDWKDIEHLSFGQISENILIEKDGDQTSTKTCKTFHLIVKSKDVGDYSFDNGSKHWYDRFQDCPDITSVLIHYEEYCCLLYIDWYGQESEYVHEHQGVCEEFDGAIRIFCDEEYKEN